MPLNVLTTRKENGEPILQAISANATTIESLLHTYPHVTLFIGHDSNATNVGMGTVYFTECRIIFHATTSELTLSLPYQYLLLHALSRDTTDFPHECVIIRIEEEVEVQGVSGEEWRLVVGKKEQLPLLFKSLTECMDLYDRMNEPNENDEEHEIEIIDQYEALEHKDDASELSDAQQAALARWDSLVVTNQSTNGESDQVEEGQFADDMETENTSK